MVRDIYELNGTPFPDGVEQAPRLRESVPLKGSAAAESAFAAWSARVRQLSRSEPRMLAFACVLFSGVSLQQSLILSWGPHVFQQLLYPGSDAVNDALPYSVLLGWNFGDWVGILFSCFLIDRLGRCGCPLISLAPHPLHVTDYHFSPLSIEVALHAPRVASSPAPTAIRP